jgi:hypothetical protein
MNDDPLRDLPAHDVPDPRAMRARATLAFEEAQDPSATRRALAFASRAVVPAFVLGTIGLYMTWAVTAATALIPQ